MAVDACAGCHQGWVDAQVAAAAAGCDRTGIDIILLDYTRRARVAPKGLLCRVLVSHVYFLIFAGPSQQI